MIGKVTEVAAIRGALALSTSVFCMSDAAAQDALVLPSGLEATLQEVRIEDKVGRFRFVAPGIGPEGRSYMEIRADFPWLCSELALPVLEQSGNEVPEVVISLADREVTFGEITPEATQFFEVFSLQDGTCVWEEF